VWGFVSLDSTHCDRVFRGGKHMVGFEPLPVCVCPIIFLQYFDAVGWVF